MLDFTSLQKAVDSLGKTLNAACDKQRMKNLDTDQQEAVRAGVIQNFEFTYELCWKFIKRWLETNIGRSEVEGVSRRALFRLGAEHKLINDVETWMIYHDARNETAHTYDTGKAQEVFEIAKRFLPDAVSLLQKMEKADD